MQWHFFAVLMCFASPARAQLDACKAVAKTPNEISTKISACSAVLDEASPGIVGAYADAKRKIDDGTGRLQVMESDLHAMNTAFAELQALYAKEQALSKEQRLQVYKIYKDVSGDLTMVGAEPPPSLPPPQDVKDTNVKGTAPGQETKSDVAREHQQGREPQTSAVDSQSPAQVIKQADEVLAKDQKNTQALEARAKARALTGDSEGAVADARKVLAQDPENELAHFIVGNRDQLAASSKKLSAMKLRLGFEPQAQDFGAAQPPPPDAVGRGLGATRPTIVFTLPPVPPAAAGFYDAARRKLELGDKEAALMDATRAIDAAPNSVLALLLRAKISRALDNPEGALADMNRALTLAPDDPNVLRERALAYLQLGRFAQALADLERAIALEPANGSSWLYKAMVLEKLGRFEEALAALAQAVALDPSLRPLADPIVARLRPKTPGGLAAGAQRRNLMRGGAIAGSLLLVFLGLLGTTRGRRALTTTAQTVLGRRKSSQDATLIQASADLAPGTVLGGLYRVERELGRGGMGVVYAAVDTALQRRVAVKRLQRDADTTQADFDRFLQEARLAAKLHHPRLAEIYNVVTEGDLYLVFEYIEGEPLDVVLQKRLRLPPAQARRVLGDVAEAVDFAHAQKIIHRDLKPSNVMLEASGSCKVMDLGIAHQSSTAATRLTRTSASGTPPYMAPEQAMGSVSKASDLYALAVMAYELLTGRRPFQGPDFLEQKLNREYPAPSSLDSSLPRNLDAFFAAALEPDPTKRAPSAAEFMARLDAALRS